MSKSISKSNSLTKGGAFTWMVALLATVCVFAHVTTAWALNYPIDGNRNIIVGNNSKVVFIGDSYAASWNGDWQKQTADMVSGLKSKNNYTMAYSCGGGIMPSGRHNFNLLIQDTAEKLGKQCKKIQYVVISGGYNDLNYGAGANRRSQKSQKKYKDALKKVIDTSKSKFPNAKILLGVIGHNRTNQDKNTSIRYIAYWCMQVVQQDYSKKNVKYMHDNVFECLKSYETYDYYKQDNVHPNKNGGAIIAKGISGYIKNIK